MNPAHAVRTVVETAIYVDDLDAAVRFYGDLLGLPVVARADGRHVFFAVGPVMLLAFLPDATLGEGPGDAHGARGPGHFALGIARDALPYWRRRLAEAGVAIVKEVAWPRGGESIYFRDPAGNLAELVTPGIWGLESGW